MFYCKSLWNIFPGHMKVLGIGIARAGTGALLNGALLELGPAGEAAAMPPVARAAAAFLEVPPTSVAFFVLPGAKHPQCMGHPV
jgi:hypothetical protein